MIGKALVTSAAFAALILSATAQQAPVRLPRDGFPMGPPAKILSFTADPSSIQPGQSVTLKWAVVNADRISVNDDLGIVEARGSRTVTPKTTMTYTLTALGYGTAGNDSKSVTVTVAGTVASKTTGSMAHGDVPLAARPVPHMPDGTPDLSGIYIAAFQSIKPTGPITLKPGAEKFKVGADYGFDLTTRCLPPGVPGTTEWPYPLQIVQKPGLVLILYESEHLFRVIPTDGRPHPRTLILPGWEIRLENGKAIRWSSTLRDSTIKARFANTGTPPLIM